MKVRFKFPLVDSKFPHGANKDMFRRSLFGHRVHREGTSHVSLQEDVCKYVGTNLHVIDQDA